MSMLEPASARRTLVASLLPLLGPPVGFVASPVASVIGVAKWFAPLPHTVVGPTGPGGASGPQSRCNAMPVVALFPVHCVYSAPVPDRHVGDVGATGGVEGHVEEVEQAAVAAEQAAVQAWSQIEPRWLMSEANDVVTSGSRRPRS